MTSTLRAMASTLVGIASTLRAMASTLAATASTPKAIVHFYLFGTTRVEELKKDGLHSLLPGLCRLTSSSPCECRKRAIQILGTLAGRGYARAPPRAPKSPREDDGTKKAQKTEEEVKKEIPIRQACHMQYNHFIRYLQCIHVFGASGFPFGPFLTKARRSSAATCSISQLAGLAWFS